jgi:SET domain-containing protein
MKKVLQHSSDIEVRKSDVHGYGVFAKNDIRTGQILEECHLLLWDKSLGHGDYMRSYRFSFPRYAKEHENCLPLGFGCIYNCSENPNIEWKCDEENKLIIFYTIKNIKKDKELYHNYSDSLLPNIILTT